MLKIPFYSNTPDNTHCFQACLKMIIEYFWPEDVYDWDKLDEITSKVKGLWTWPMAGLIYMQERGAEVKVIETFDYNSFVEKGEDYLLEKNGKEVADIQIKNSDINGEIKFAKKFIKTIKIKKDIPEIDNLKKMLMKGYIIMVNINSRVLDKQEGYAGHFVLLKGFDEKGFIINDPGLPGIENRKVLFDLFERAWAYPDEKSKNIMAFRLKQK